MTRKEQKEQTEQLNAELMQQLDDAGIPEEVTEYAKTYALNHDYYGWFKKSTTKDHKTTIVCKACGSEYEGIQPKHNTYEYCPNCGNSILMRRCRASKSHHIEKRRGICYFQKVDDVIVIRLFANSIYYTDSNAFRKDVASVIEEQRIIYRQRSVTSYRNWYSNYEDKYVLLKTERNYNDFYDNKCIQRPSEIEELFKGTRLEKNIWLWLDYPNKTLKTLYKFATWPTLEYLYKLGYKKLVDEITHGREKGDITVNLFAKKANAVLGVPHSILQKYNPEILRECDIKAIKQLIDYGRLGQLTPERMTFISSILERRSLDPLEIFRTFGIEKVQNYLTRQVEKYDEHNAQACSVYGMRDTSVQTIWRDFNDYRKECHELGYDLTDEGVMFPKDLASAHTRTSKLAQDRRDKLRKKELAATLAQQRAAYKKAIKKILNKEFDGDGYILRVCTSPEELTEEGKQLHHCVGGYVDRVVEGSCLIFFLRTQQEPDTPLYTIEVNPKTMKIVQMRGKNNAAAPTELLAFAEIWVKALSKKAA
jgi:predicted RNA-binding Zn-ribbon protein involved in translation (DUF1610 family)